MPTLPPDATIVAPPRARPEPAAPPKRRRRLRTTVKTLVVLAVLAGIGTGLYALSRQVYFLGTNDAGLVTLYRGIPYELPFGVDLYRAAVRERRARAGRSRARGASACSTTNGAAATTPQDLLRTLERGQLSG